MSFNQFIWVGGGFSLADQSGPTDGPLSLTHFGRDWQGIGEDRITHTLSPRATARVPTPLHTTPALTMTTRGIT
jgi:hypothetical protein